MMNNSDNEINELATDIADNLDNNDLSLTKTASNTYGSYVYTNGSSALNTQVQINSQPLNLPPSWTTISTYSSSHDEDPKPCTIEIKTIDGRRHIVRLSSGDSLDDIEERNSIKIKFSFKFPFIIKEKKTYVHFRMSNYYHTANGNQPKEFDIDCNLSAFCKLIGVEYKGFSEALMEDAIENG